ncbi:MAG: S16 family serine protease [Actinomycetota bacterium]
MAAVESRPWFRDPFSVVVLGLVAVLIAAAIGYYTVPAQWVGRIPPGSSVVDDGAVALKPGSARATDDRVSVSAIEIFEPEGEILFTTVAIDDQVTIADWVSARTDDAVELRTREQVFGTRTTAEQRERNLQLMAVSKESAVIAALEYLGVQAVIESGVGFNAVVPDGPVDGLLEVGEIIVAMDDTLITGIDSLLAALEARPPGTETELTLENVDTGEFRSQVVTLGVHPDEGRTGGFIGIQDVTIRATDADLPFDLDIDSGAIGGPSAGLAFTLTIIDLLTEGELTGGNRVAVTGTISAGGSVGNVGGVAQKARAAEEAGAAVFIVPVDSVEDAESTTDDLRIVGVTTLDEAIDVLAGLGGDVTELALDVEGVTTN